MLRVRRGERRWSRLRVASTSAVIAVLACTSAAWGLIGGGTPPATFAVTLDGEFVTTAKAYALDGAFVSGKREYTLRVSLALTDNSAPAQAFQTGQTIGSAEVALLAPNLAVALKTYTLVGATVSAYRQSGDAATNAFTQELVLKSKTLTVG